MLCSTRSQNSSLSSWVALEFLTGATEFPCQIESRSNANRASNSVLVDEKKTIMFNKSVGKESDVGMCKLKMDRVGPQITFSSYLRTSSLQY